MNLDRRVLVYTSVTFVFLIFVGLMLLPLGLPRVEHVISYWWADPYFKMAVGQEHKILWYKKAFYSFAFLFWIGLSAWIGFRLLLNKRPAVLLTWAVFVYCFSTIFSQFLVVGGWETFAQYNLADMFDDCPSFVKIVDRIDSPAEFMKDMVKYAGVDGRLRGTLGTKAAPFILMFYYVDQVTRALIGALGLPVSDLALRAAFLSAGFTVLTSLFLIPMFFLFRLLFSVTVARVAILILAMNPLAAHGFSHLAAQGHHILIPVSALALLLVTIGLMRGRPAVNVLGIAVAAVASLMVWESIAFAVLLVFINALYLYRKSAFKIMTPKRIAISALSVVGLMVLTWATFKVAFGLDLAKHFVDHFVVLHLGPQFHRLFVANGPLPYFLTQFTNPFQFLFFLGVPLATQMYFSLKDQWRSGLQLKRLEGILILGTLIFIVLLSLSGMATETSRLWAFLAPPVYLAALAEFGKLKDKTTLIVLGASLYILLGLQIIVMRNVQYSV